MGLLNDELDEGRSAKGQSSTEPNPLADPDEDPLDPGEPGP
jgi:hypothetical protein